MESGLNSTHRSLEEGFVPNTANLVAKSSDETSYTDSGLAAETTYYYTYVPSVEGYTNGRASATTEEAPPPPVKQWGAGEPITITGEITSDVTPQMSDTGVETLFVFPGQEVRVTMAAASDVDKWTLGDREETEPDSLTYEWKDESSAGTGALSNTTGSSTTWRVPTATGDNDSMEVTLRCIVDDTPTEIAEGEGGTRNDDDTSKTIKFTVVRRKWNADPAIGQHPPLDENGNFDIHNPNWIDDGLIVAPDPGDGPHQVLAGARVGVAVSEAHDWDGWMLSGLGNGGGEDAPLSYTWTAGKGHFAVLDAQGNETESDSATGVTATWVAPSDLDTDETSVEIKCTIDDLDGARVGATEAGTRDDEALERTVSVKVVKVEVTFEDELARACAGGIAVDGVHDFTITGTARKPDGTFPPAGTEFKLVFENNKGHDYSGNEPGIKPTGWTTEQIKKAKFVTSDANGAQELVEELMVTTDENGEFPVQVLSSDIVSSDITIKVKSVNDDGEEEEEVGEKECDFGAAESKRGFANSYDESEAFPSGDTGWLFNQRWLRPQVQTTAKVYLQFKVNSDGGDLPSNWRRVNGHRMLFVVDDVTMRSGGGASSSDYKQFGYFSDNVRGTVLETTRNDGSLDGAATALFTAGSNISQSSTVWVTAYDQNQWDD